jgi:hypothetical protein
MVERSLLASSSSAHLSQERALGHLPCVQPLHPPAPFPWPAFSAWPCPRFLPHTTCQSPFPWHVLISLLAPPAICSSPELAQPGRIPCRLHPWRATCSSPVVPRCASSPSGWPSQLHSPSQATETLLHQSGSLPEAPSALSSARPSPSPSRRASPCAISCSHGAQSKLLPRAPLLPCSLFPVLLPVGRALLLCRELPLGISPAASAPIVACLCP